MKKRLQMLAFLILVSSVSSCIGNAKKIADTEEEKTEEKSYEELVKEQALRDQKASDITADLCGSFPKELVMQYNPDALRLEIESVERIPGKESPCKLKLFYGDKDHEFWEGQIGAWAPKTEDPLWQYDSKRSPSIYHEVTEFGEQGVFITNTNQLLVIKNGMMYSIVPPGPMGAYTNTRKPKKEIALEIARHYKL